MRHFMEDPPQSALPSARETQPNDETIVQGNFYKIKSILLVNETTYSSLKCRMLILLQDKATIISLTCLIGVASGILQTRAFDTSFRTAGKKSGETTDADFFTNLQTTLMQLLGLYTTLIPALKYQYVTYPFWAWTFAAGSFVCSVVSIGIYFWFAALAPLVAFAGCCLQAFMVLQLVWLIDEKEKEGQKMKVAMKARKEV
jgi:hypothetical protein